MKNRKLFTLIFPTYLILIVLVTAFFTLYEQNAHNAFYLKEVQKDMEARARLIRNQISSADFENKIQLDSLIQKLSQSGYIRLTIILPDGMVIADSDKDFKTMDNHADRPEIISAFGDSVGHSVRYSKTLEKQLIYLALPMREKDQTVAAVRIAFPLSAYKESIYGLRNRILLGGFLALVLGILFSYFVSRLISKPLQEIEKGTAQFASGNFDFPLPEIGSSEIKSLSTALNSMARDLKRKIETISIQRSEQEAMFRSMREGLLAITDDGKIIHINQAAKQLFNVDEKAAEKRLAPEIIQEKAVLDFLQKAISRDEHLDKEITIPGPAKKIFRLSSDPLRDINSNKIGTLILINEITRIKQLDKIRRDFVANVSHELKTPITSIKGYVETLKDGHIEDSETQNKFLDIVARQTDRMDALINDLLQLSQIEQEKEGDNLQKSEAEIWPVIQTAVEELHKMADKKNMRIKVSGNKEATAVFNRSLMERAIINLLNNAIKYSEENSEILVRISSDTSEVKISVRDFGCGIEQKHHNRLFERFYRVDKARSREMGGTGLGLAIVKHIAGIHGGTIEVNSNPGKGSTFTLYLPKR